MLKSLLFSLLSNSRRFFSLLTISMLFLISGCYYDVEEELYAGCNSSGATYTNTVVPMLQSNGCLGCHSAPASGGAGIILDNYNSLVSVVQDNNRFITGADRMPPGSSTGVLTECDMSKLRAWVNAGALNN